MPANLMHGVEVVIIVPISSLFLVLLRGRAPRECDPGLHVGHPGDCGQELAQAGLLRLHVLERDLPLVCGHHQLPQERQAGAVREVQVQHHQAR